MRTNLLSNDGWRRGTNFLLDSNFEGINFTEEKKSFASISTVFIYQRAPLCFYFRHKYEGKKGSMRLLIAVWKCVCGFPFISFSSLALPSTFVLRLFLFEHSGDTRYKLCTEHWLVRFTPKWFIWLSFRPSFESPKTFWLFMPLLLLPFEA